MWQRHWGLARDPFAGTDSPYVPLPSHEEALARLVYSIEQSHRHVLFRAEAGLGKTTVLRRAVAETRSPRRRFAVVGSASDGTQLLSRIADRLGVPIGRELNRHSATRAIGRAFRAATLQGIQVVVAIDRAHEELEPVAVHDLMALADFGDEPEAQFTLVQVSGMSSDRSSETAEAFTLAIGLQRMTRTDAELFLQAKLAAAGCTERVFTPRAITRIHARSRGVPRALEQIATLSLMAAASRGLEVIPPDVIDGVVQACFLAEAGLNAMD